MADEKTQPFQMRASPEWLQKIDDWRRQQPDIPSRAEAIRRLVDVGLDQKAIGYVAPDPSKTRVFHQNPKDYGPPQ
ncbi:hypothetical protein VH570_10765 [Sphingobium sp. HT1-2]|uniref:hypothetical protein n=1 Tax=Sphingobium sp. HT1-2 TaxID=3111640 RepID=UPI003C00C5C5